MLYLVSAETAPRATGQLAEIHAQLLLPLESQLAATESGEVARLRLGVEELAKERGLVAPPPPVLPPPPPPIPPPPPPVTSPATGLVNCIAAVPGRLNMWVWWAVRGLGGGGREDRGARGIAAPVCK